MSLENGRDLFFWPIYFKGTNIMGIIAKQFRRVEQIGSLCVSHSLKLVQIQSITKQIHFWRFFEAKFKI